MEQVGQKAQPIERRIKTVSSSMQTLKLNSVKIGGENGYARLDLAGYYSIRTTTGCPVQCNRYYYSLDERNLHHIE